MSPEKQRIAIAEACGWAHFPHDSITGTYEHMIRGDTYAWMTNRRWENLPDYLNDLNAMHEAFKRLGRHWEIKQVHDGYVCRIEFGPKHQDVVVGGFELLPVMSEAFLRTLGKWEESQ